MKPAVIMECGKTTMKICKELTFYYLSVVITLRQEASKHTQLSSHVLSFHFASLCLNSHVSWEVETHEKLQDTVHTKGCIESKTA